MNRLRRIALAAVLAGLAGCTAPEPPVFGEPSGPAAPEGAWLLPGTVWRLVALDGRPYPARFVARLGEDGRIRGEGPCNAFTADYAGRWPDVRFAVTATERACPELDAETAAFERLAAVERAAVGVDGLTLSAPDGNSLRFERL